MKTVPATTRYSSSPTGLLIGLLVLLPLLAPLAVRGDALVVSNVRAIQRPGTQLVDIYYNLTAATATVKVAVLVSADGGTNWNVPAYTFTGAYGPGVTAGKDRMLTWNAGLDWPGKFSPAMRFRVTADDGTATAPPGFVLIPAGSFQMGDQSPAPKDGTSWELPVHTVTVSAFYMGTTEVTKSQWDAAYSYATANGYTFDNPGQGKAANHPVHTVSWYDIVKWCNAKSQQDGVTPCYTVSGATYKTGQQSGVVCDFTRNGYRLPTEAEWEKAARGGLSGKRFPWGDTITHSQANYYSSSSYSYDISPTRGLHPIYNDNVYPYTSPVGAFAANGYGLYDMSGNVWEWCWDWYGSSYYSSSPATDPTGAATGSFRVLRGGSWFNWANDSANINAYGTRVAYRSYNDPPNRSYYGYYGFRLARGRL